MLLASNVSGTSTRYRWLYRWLDDNAITIGKAIVAPHYRTVSLLKGNAVTRDAFVTRVRVLAKGVGTQALDVFLNLHGERDALRFADGRAKLNDLGDELAALDLGHRLRLLYSTCCWGARHAPHFVAAGFKTASGARGINANGPYDLPVQLTRWTSGATYAAAVRSANHAGMMEIHDRLARLAGFKNVDSFKEVHGTKSLRITSRAD
jgi:hypothetical protein